MSTAPHPPPSGFTAADMETTARVLDALAARVKAAREEYVHDHPERVAFYGNDDLGFAFLTETWMNLANAAEFVRDEYVTPLPTPVAEGAAE